MEDKASAREGVPAQCDDTLNGAREQYDPNVSEKVSETTPESTLTYASSVALGLVGDGEEVITKYDSTVLGVLAEAATARRASAELQIGTKIPNTISEGSKRISTNVHKRSSRTKSADTEAEFIREHAQKQSSVLSLTFYSSTGGAILSPSSNAEVSRPKKKPSVGHINVDPNEIAAISCASEPSPRTPWSGEDFVHFSKSIYYKVILPLCVAFFIGTGAVTCASIAMQWDGTVIIVLALATVQLFASTGVLLVAFFYIYKHWESPLIASRGKVHSILFLISMTLHKPILFVQTMFFAGLIQQKELLWMALVVSGRLCSMVWVGAIVARQRQIVQVFHISLFKRAPVHTYRNTFLGICAMYLMALLVALGLLHINVKHWSLPYQVADFISFGILALFIYQSRYVSARFSDYYASIRWVVLMFMSYVCIIAQKVVPFGNVYNMQGELIANWTGVLIVDSMLLSTTVIILDTFVPLIYVVENKLDRELIQETYSIRSLENSSSQSQYPLSGTGSSNFRTRDEESDGLESVRSIGATGPIGVIRTEGLSNVHRLASRSTSSAICVVATAIPTTAIASPSERPAAAKEGKKIKSARQV